MQGVPMKGTQNKFISQKLSYTYPVYVIRKENSLEFLFMPSSTRMRQLVTFGELSNVDTTGTGSVCAVAGRVAVSYGCSVSF
jgi:hypothetical protein